MPLIILTSWALCPLGPTAPGGATVRRAGWGQSSSSSLFSPCSAPFSKAKTRVMAFDEPARALPSSVTMSEDWRGARRAGDPELSCPSLSLVNNGRRQACLMRTQ